MDLTKNINIMQDFQYAINIAYDINSDDKIKNYIPTPSAIEIIEDIMLSTSNTSNDRAKIFVGAYGKGKSHLALIIASLLYRKEPELFSNLLSYICQSTQNTKGESELCTYTKNYLDSKKKMLPVIIHGSSMGIRQALMSGLSIALKNANLDHIMPDTYFKSAITTIQNWQENYKDTYNEFKKHIDCNVKNYITELENFNIDYYENFKEIYPSLTAGSEFNPISNIDVIELYNSVNKSLKKEGYTGIYVIYDEFSKFLEGNLNKTSAAEIKTLQDFAENCCRTKEQQLHILLISHQSILNYVDKLPKNKIDAWKAVSNRFKTLEFNTSLSQQFDLMSKIICQDSKWYKEYLKDNEKRFNNMMKKWEEAKSFSSLEYHDIERIVIGCYPLQAITTFLLPNISEKIAQNERTIFTFLSSRNQKHTLYSYLKENNQNFPLLTPDYIYDYFEPLFRKESYSSDLHKNYILAKTILENLEPDSLETKIIKTIALIYTLEQFDKIKPTINELDGIYSIDYSHEDIRNAIDNLIHKEYVIYLKLSNEFLQLKQSSGIDVKQKIADTIELKGSNFSVKDTLNNASLDNYMYPSRYNDEREMTRFFAFRFIDGAEVNEDVDWEVKSEGIDADGVVYGIITEDEDSLETIKTALLNTSQGQKRMVFILPKKHTEIRNVVMQFNAVTILRDAAIADEILFDEYEVIYEDLREVISDFINTYTHPENYKSCYIYDGAEKNIFRKAALTGLLSDICNDVYSMTPIINNEVINKNELSGVAYGSRSKIISALLRNVIENNLGFNGTGQEVSIMRSTLVRTNILVNDGTSASINLHTRNANLDNMLNVICDFIRKGVHLRH